jgi:serine protease Do
MASEIQMRAILFSVLMMSIGVLASQADPYDSQERVIDSVAKKVGQLVVRIETSGGQDLIVWGGKNQPIRKVAGPTTGLIIDADGYIITSTFNFSNKPTDIFVTVPGRGRSVARVVGTDQTRMVTLLKVEMKDLPIPKFVPKSEMVVGMTTIALGRVVESNAEKTPSINTGILSAIGRIWGKAVQTDAKISPTNYGGPLASLDGRILGILVPASPQGEGENAGVEWYDSGIGFAIPLEDINRVLPKLKSGTPEKPVTLRGGLMGVTFKSTDMYGDLPTINVIAPNSAAEKAGLKSEDVFVEIDQKAVVSQAQLMHVLKPKYEGDAISLKVKRGKDVVEIKNLVLQGTQTDFENGFLGVLPMRDDPEPGLEVRYVYPNSPAEKTGLKPGDRIMKLAPKGVKNLVPFSGRDQFSTFLGTQPNGAEIQFEIKPKDGKEAKTVTARLSTFSESIPVEISGESSKKRANERPKPVAPAPEKGPKLPKKEPKVEEPAPKKDDKKLETGLLKRKNPEQGREYWIYVPKNYDPNVAYGLMVWLHGAGTQGRDADDVVELWSTAATRFNMILLGPISNNQDGWVAGESEYVIGDVKGVIQEYRIDPARILVHGQGVGGQMAYYLGFQARDLFRGVAVHGSVLANQPKDNTIGQKLQFFISAGKSDPLYKDIQESEKKLRAKKFPLIFRGLENVGKQYLDADPGTFADLVHWIDSLDRL